MTIRTAIKSLLLLLSSSTLLAQADVTPLDLNGLRLGMTHGEATNQASANGWTITAPGQFDVPNRGTVDTASILVASPDGRHLAIESISTSIDSHERHDTSRITGLRFCGPPFALEDHISLKAWMERAFHQLKERIGEPKIVEPFPFGPWDGPTVTAGGIDVVNVPQSVYNVYIWDRGVERIRLGIQTTREKKKPSLYRLIVIVET